MALIDDVKVAMRISATAFNTELTDLIAAAKADLSLSGVAKVDETDTLIKRAIITYAKANFGWNNPDAVRLQQSYDMLKAHLSLSLEYSYYAVTITVTASAVAVDEAEIVFNGETKYTGTAGTAIFYVKAGNNYEYSVYKSGYALIEGDTDITANTAVAIALVAG